MHPPLLPHKRIQGSHQFMIILFAFDNDDMESSKRRITFLSLIFLLQCTSKSIVITIIRTVTMIIRIVTMIIRIVTTIIRIVTMIIRIVTMIIRTVTMIIRIVTTIIRTSNKTVLLRLFCSSRPQTIKLMFWIVSLIDIHLKQPLFAVSY